MSQSLKDLVLYAWVGEDEFGTGEIGLKQAAVPAGMVPLVATNKDKINRPYIQNQLREVANQYGKTRHLVKFTLSEVITTIEPEAT